MALLFVCFDGMFDGCVVAVFHGMFDGAIVAVFQWYV